MLPSWDPDRLLKKIPFVLGLVGGRRQGKSTAVADLLSRMSERYDLVICMVGSAACNPVLESLLHTHWDAVEEGARDVGKTADRSLWRVAREVFIADTTAEARKMVREGGIGRAFNEYFIRSLTKSGMLRIMKNDPDMPGVFWVVSFGSTVDRSRKRLGFPPSSL